MRKAVFLDRDGTINVDTGYVNSKGEFTFIPGVFEGIRKLQDAGFFLVVITDQSGIGRGYYTEAQFHNVMKHMNDELQKQGILPLPYYFCPHTPQESCGCKKPGTANVRKAVEEHDLDISRSFFIGDKKKDVLCGQDAGCKGILVKTGTGGSDVQREAIPDYTAKDLEDAAEWILEQ